MNGIELVRCTRVFDEAKRFNPAFDPAVTTILEADTVILAIGQSTDLSFLAEAERAPVTEQGTILVDATTLPTPVAGVLASGARLEEAISSYKSIGLEAHLELAQAKDLACSECQPPQLSAAVEGAGTSSTRVRKIMRRVTRRKRMISGESIAIIKIVEPRSLPP